MDKTGSTSVRWRLAGLVVAVALAGITIGYGARAAETPPRKTSEQRIAELEAKVAAMEFNLRAMQTRVDRALQLGPQLLHQR